MGRFITIVGALVAVHIAGISAQDVPSCIASCASQVRAEFTSFGCANADDAACLCPSTSFSFGIRDCASATCGGTDADVQNYLKPDFCLNFALPAASDAAPSTTVPAPTTTTTVAASTEPVTTTQAPTTTEPPTTTEALPTTSAVPSETTQQAASVTTASLTSDPATTTASPAATSATSSLSSSASASSTPAAEGSKDGDGGDKEESGSGLSQGATIGVAVGVSLAAIAIAALGICLFLRKRKQKLPPRGRQVEISKPLPGSGPTYLPGDRGSYEKYQTDIEMTTNRYEDMPPRQVPRTMV